MSGAPPPYDEVKGYPPHPTLHHRDIHHHKYLCVASQMTYTLLNIHGNYFYFL